jgi:hypothetical protein
VPLLNMVSYFFERVDEERCGVSVSVGEFSKKSLFSEGEVVIL